MAMFILLVMLTACAAAPQDLLGKMFTFPEETSTAHVRITTSRQLFSAVTVCHRTFTDLKRSYATFSLATPSVFNDFLIYMKANDLIQIDAKDVAAEFVVQDYRLNTWHSICATWDSSSGVGQVWLDGKPLNRRFTRSGSNISGPVIIVLGQDQDSYGGAFSSKQSFVGMMSDVHMWDHVLTPSEIQDYTYDQGVISGNVLSWRELEFEIRGRVLIEGKQI